MRMNASIPALLALAVLFLLPVTLPAKTTRHRAHTASRSASVHRSHKKPAHSESAHATRHRRSRTKTVRVSGPQSTAGHHLHRTGTMTAKRAATSETADAGTQKATSSDFIQAATADTREAGTSAHDKTREDAHAEAHSPRRRARSRRSARAVPVTRRGRQRPEPLRTTEATVPMLAPTPVVLYNKRGRLIVPPPLRGSHEILVRQNEVADRDGLTRIQNDEDLDHMRSEGLLVALPENAALHVDDRLPADRRYCRPWTARFLANLARAHYARFHTPLQVNSAVRTVEFQEHLMRINGNAAPADGDTASPHLTGQAVDLAKHGLSRTEIAWMRGYLLPLVQEGRIDVEEEFKQSCFHISVYKNYVPQNAGPRRSISATRSSEAALATAIR